MWKIRQRQRYLDLMANEEVRDTFPPPQPDRPRAIRRNLDERGYLEVETPVLQEEAGGSRGRGPFEDLLAGPR